MSHPLAHDLDHILNYTGDVWPELRGARLFVTGGTGFFGCWLLDSFARANDTLGLGAEAVVLTRDPAAFRRKEPWLAAHPAIRFHSGDVRSFDFPSGGFSHVIHAATDSSTGLDVRDPLCMLHTIVEGTRRTLDFAVACGARKFLLTSSGAVYGRQPPHLTHMPETWTGGPDPADPRSVYAEGKRAAEMLCAIYCGRGGLQTKIARCFAFVGPRLPLDAHFAVGNFIRDQLAGGPIRINGDGTPFRSYLYAADLAIWLWTILTRGQAGRPYNVGSEEDISISNLAAAVARTLGPHTEVQVASKPVPDALPSRYVPSTGRARHELELAQHVPIEESIRRTAAWSHQRASESTDPALDPREVEHVSN
jgi:dTDP-glucose 4,6-dehydratase